MDTKPKLLDELRQLSALVEADDYAQAEELLDDIKDDLKYAKIEYHWNKRQQNKGDEV